MQSKNELTFVVVGARNTGKTMLVEYFVYGPNTKPTRPTIEDVYRKSLSNGKIINIIDTSGEESTIDKLRELYISTADGFIITFDFKHLKTLARAKLEYEHVANFGKPITIVATHVGPISTDRFLSRVLFRKANFFTVDLHHRENCSAIFESLAAEISPHRRRFSCCCC